MNKIIEAGWNIFEGFLTDNDDEKSYVDDETFGAEFSVDHVLNSEKK